MKSETVANITVVEVRKVRPRVKLIAWFAKVGKSIFKSLRKSSRIRSKITIVSLIE